MKKTFRHLKALILAAAPPEEWLLPVLFLLGGLCGLGLLIFNVSNASSYLSEDPRTCINCHVMVPQYETWQKGSHGRDVTCMDCHVPHDNIIHKYEFKAKDGTRHATIFTLRQEQQVIRIKPEGRAVVQENCIRCHSGILQDVSIHKTTYEDYLKGDGKLCWECHRDVPHGTVRSLSATPYVQSPQLPDPSPGWLKKFFPLPDNPSMNEEDKHENHR
ncbi:MAG: cytochrome c nitrite reductase small subunit [Candidatus Omnitrophota bacterium]|nr:cytochrome c nitrite reductase small subunit [Candidatus Omnitrophota bacterium]MDZ4242236.1 cytochrome c nitrite reductase small subunit [Candidatus Omnitrophota bacterium]